MNLKKAFLVVAIAASAMTSCGVQDEPNKERIETQLKEGQHGLHEFFNVNSHQKVALNMDAVQVFATENSIEICGYDHYSGKQVTLRGGLDLKTHKTTNGGWFSDLQGAEWERLKKAHPANFPANK